MVELKRFRRGPGNGTHESTGYRCALVSRFQIDYEEPLIGSRLAIYMYDKA